MTTPPALTITDDVLTAGSVRLVVDSARADVVLARPEVRNAQVPAMWAALAAVPALLPEPVRVVVLSGEGASFSAGLDRRMFDPAATDGLAGLAAGTPEQIDTAIAGFQQAFTWWRQSDRVTIAAVQGHAVGAGFQLALGCDLMLCADDAQLAMRETSLGLVPDLGGTSVLVDAVGYSRALEICATGRWVRSEEAVARGIAVASVPAGSLSDSVDDLVAALLGAPAGALSATKRLLAGTRDRSRAEQLVAERREQSERLADLVRLLG